MRSLKYRIIFHIDVTKSPDVDGLVSAISFYTNAFINKKNTTNNCNGTGRISQFLYERIGNRANSVRSIPQHAIE